MPLQKQHRERTVRHRISPDALIVAGRDTFENWQSEFLQLLWQVVGLAYFLYVGSPSSKENGKGVGGQLDAIIRMIGGDEAEN